MSTRSRKLVGALFMVGFLIFYAVAAASLADKLPDQPYVKLIYFALVGVLWGVPMLPLIVWMNRSR